MKVKIISTIGCFMLLASTNCFAGVAGLLAADAAKTAIEETGKTVRTQIEKTEEVKITNTDIINDVDMLDSTVVGNTGIELKGSKIEVQDSLIDNKVKLRNSTVVGNSGISIGD